MHCQKFCYMAGFDDILWPKHWKFLMPWKLMIKTWSNYRLLWKSGRENCRETQLDLYLYRGFMVFCHTILSDAWSIKEWYQVLVIVFVKSLYKSINSIVLIEIFSYSICWCEWNLKMCSIHKIDAIEEKFIYILSVPLITSQPILFFHLSSSVI